MDANKDVVVVVPLVASTLVEIIDVSPDVWLTTATDVLLSVMLGTRVGLIVGENVAFATNAAVEFKDADKRQARSSRCVVVIVWVSVVTVCVVLVCVVLEYVVLVCVVVVPVAVVVVEVAVVVVMVVLVQVTDVEVMVVDVVRVVVVNVVVGQPIG